MFLEKIKEDKWVKFIQSSFKKTNKKISIELARAIPRLMKNHSWYVQQLSHYTWNRCKSTCEAEHINKALNELIQANSPLYMREIEILSATQINWIKAIVQGEKQLTSTRVMHEYRLGTPRNVSKNRMTLERADMLNKTESGYELLDPAFEIWFRMYFFKEALPSISD